MLRGQSIIVLPDFDNFLSSLDILLKSHFRIRSIGVTVFEIFNPTLDISFRFRLCPRTSDILLPIILSLNIFKMISKHEKFELSSLLIVLKTLPN
jgi:hypothetical protein